MQTVFEFPSVQKANFVYDTVRFPFSPDANVEDRLKKLGFDMVGQPEQVKVEYYDFETWDLAKQGRFYKKLTFSDGTFKIEGKIASDVGGNSVFMNHPVPSFLLREEYKLVTFHSQHCKYVKNNQTITIERIRYPDDSTHTVGFFSGDAKDLQMEMYFVTKTPARDDIQEYLFRYEKEVFNVLFTVIPIP